MSDRPFRTPESYEAEEITRNMLVDFLLSKGFTGVVDRQQPHGRSISQLMEALSLEGYRVGYQIRLCWHRKRQDIKEHGQSAAQLLSKVNGGDWEGSLSEKVDRDRKHGATHYLIVQRERNDISIAAAIPVMELVPVWCAQRDRSQALINEGKLGKRTKNHAMNGTSPTIYLRDAKAPEVAAALWNHPGVIDLALMPDRGHRETQSLKVDDTFDDLPDPDYGSDSPAVKKCDKSYVKRDPRVRAAVAQRAQGRCERSGCGIERSYSGFLDVHHVLGARKSDRIWNCVALCPNCHRGAHFSPDRDIINASLLAFASQFE